MSVRRTSTRRTSTAGSWKTMNIPGIWELNGYGDPEYVNIGLAWRYQFKDNNVYKGWKPEYAPENATTTSVPVKDNHVGSYRRVISSPLRGTASRSSPISANCHVEHVPLCQRISMWATPRTRR